MPVTSSLPAVTGFSFALPQQSLNGTPPRYRHYKGGEYEFLGIAVEEKSCEDRVVYRSLADGTIWIRPVEEFFGMVQDRYAAEEVPRRRFTPLQLAR